jgi:hypothetical protein
MNLLRATGNEILGLFLDDEFLAVAALVVVSSVAVLLRAFSVVPLTAGGVLLGGCVGVLLISIWRTAHAR